MCQPSPVNITHDHQYLTHTASLKQYLTILIRALTVTFSRALTVTISIQNLESHHLHHRHYPRLNTAVTQVFSPLVSPRPASSFAAVNTNICQWMKYNGDPAVSTSNYCCIPTSTNCSPVSPSPSQLHCFHGDRFFIIFIWSPWQPPAYN